MFKFFLDLLFPQFCFFCKKEGFALCPDCLSLVSIAESCFCPFCTFKTEKPATCRKHQGCHLDGLFSASSYQEKKVQKLIQSFKDKPFLRSLKRPLSSLIISHIFLTENNKYFASGENSLFVALPLIKKRQNQRGYNQAQELAKELSAFFRIPLERNNLLKTKETIKQTELLYQEREENIKGAFKLKDPACFKNKRVFLVDDILTTGTTLEEAAKVLKTKGKAREVYGVVIAREPLMLKK